MHVFNTPNAGLGHAKACIKKMAKLALDGAQSYPIRALATRIVHNVPSKNVRGELAALYVWVRDNIRYRFDPVGMEWIQAPWRTVQEAAGDCDDMTTLLAALTQALGHRVRYRTIHEPGNAHVQMQAWDGTTWIDLDPVLERQQPTTAPRPNDLGTFAQRVVGVDHYYDAGGNMLGFVADPRLMKLWIFTPWEDPNFATRQPAVDSASVYRSPNTTGGPPRPYLIRIPSGAVDESRGDAMGRVPYMLSGMQGYLQPAPNTLGAVNQVLEDRAAAYGYGKPATLAALRKWWSALKSDNRQMWRASVQSIDRYAPAGTWATKAAWWGKLSSSQRQHYRGHFITLGPMSDFATAVDSVASAAESIPLVRDFVGPVARMTATAAKLAAGQHVPIMELAHSLASQDVIDYAVANAATFPGGEALLAVAKAAGVLPQAPQVSVLPPGAQRVPSTAKLPRGAKPFAIANNTTRQIATREDIDQLAHLIRTTAPKGKKAWDSKGKRWVNYTLAGIRPNISFSLGETSVLTQLAHGAIADVAAYIQRNGHPPASKRQAVLQLQQADGQLSRDAEWGPNSRVAAAYYVGQPVSSMPPVAAAYAHYPITWTPPAAAPTAAQPTSSTRKKSAHKTAKVPAAAQPMAAHTLPWYQSAALVGAAQAAVAEIRASIKRSGHPPETKLRSVADYQAKHKAALVGSGQTGASVATIDGLYGPATRTLMAQTLNVSEAQLPPVAAVYTHHAAHHPASVHTATSAAPAQHAITRTTPVHKIVAHRAAAKSAATRPPETVSIEDAQPVAVSVTKGVTVPGMAKDKDNTWLWAAGLYLWSRNRESRRHA